MSIKKPKKCICKQEAQELQKQWCDTRQNAINSCLGFEDSREFWWSLEELQEYLNYVREESNKQQIINPGIRVYLGAYPEKKCKENKGMTTIFLAPTGVPRGERGKDGALQPNNYNIESLNGAGGGSPPHIY